MPFGAQASLKLDIGKYIFGTDNLFKFLALSGLAIVIFAFIYPSEKQQELDYTIIEINKQDHILKKEIDFLKNKIELAKTKKNSILDRLRSLKKQRDSIAAKTSSAESNLIAGLDAEAEILKSKINLDVESILNDSHEINLKGTECDYLIEKARVSDHYVKYYHLYFYALVIVGLLMCIIGFSGWYKFQKVNNEMQDLQVRTARKNLGDQQ